MNKTVSFEPHNKILDGVKKLSKAVAMTLGPCGKNVIIGRKNKIPLITKDGVTVARHISWSDELENIGATLVKEVAGFANKAAGDGTTTATILACAIYEEGLNHIDKGVNPIDLKREIDTLVDRVVDDLEKDKKELTTVEEAIQVALISTNNDVLLADLIGRGVFNTGVNGFVSVEDSVDDKTTIKFVEGLQLERGIISPYFMNDSIRERTVYDKPNFLIVNHTIDNLDCLVPVMTWAKKNNKPVVVMAEAYEDNVLTAIVANNVKAGVKIICLHLPGSGEYKSDYVSDIAKAVGAQVFQLDYEPMLKDFNPEMLGTAKQIISTFKETNISTEINIQEHILRLKDTIESATNDFHKEKLKDRYARLTSGIAILSLASESDTEQNDKRLRVEDGIRATKAALLDGYVCGGGLPLFAAANKLTADNPAEIILKKALRAPIEAILENAGEDPQKVLPALMGNTIVGWDARVGEPVDMYAAGIIDPFKVTKSALKHAASVAGMLLTSGCCITEEEIK